MEEKDYLKAVETLFNLGASKETTLEIMHEILFNSTKYVDNQENIDIMLKEKLGIDSDKKKIISNFVKKNMKEEKQAIETLFNIGVSKETTLEIMHEILFNSTKYVDNQENIDIMLKEKLGIDSDKKNN